jgi:hypothetical protein
MHRGPGFAGGIKCLGYTGSLSHLERLLSQWRRAGRPAGVDGPEAKTAVLSDPSTGNLISPIVAAALCIKPRGLLTEPQAEGHVCGIRCDAQLGYAVSRYIAWR